MMKKILPLIGIICLVFSVLTSVAQPSALRFDTPTWDFGEIPEDGGVVTHRFAFTNTGTRPVVLTNVVSNCGCTVPRFSRQPIMAGARDTITVTFNPLSRPGDFNKVVTVFTSEEGDLIRLRVMGRVKPRERNLEERYPYELGGGLYAAVGGHSFGYLRHGRMGQSAVGVANVSSRTITLTPRYGRRSGRLTVEAPRQLAPGEEAVVNFRYDLTDESVLYGTLVDEVGFVVDGSTIDNWMEIGGIVVDNPLKYSDNSVPKAVVSENFVKFGAVKYGSGEVTRWITLRNEGSEPLAVRAVEHALFDCSLRADERIAPGEERRIAIRFASGDHGYGVVVDRIRIITDDPARPMLSVRVTAVVER